jgi:TubC N-terminal docking domain
LNVGNTLYAISEAGLTLKTSKTEDTLKVYPAEKLTPELAAAIKEHKADIIRILREDEEMARTGIVQSERQVFEMAREYFGLDKSGGRS